MPRLAQWLMATKTWISTILGDRVSWRLEKLMDTLDITPLRNAVAALEASLLVVKGKDAATTPEAEMNTLRSGVIQNFEVAYELCWKFMQRWLEVFKGDSAVDFWGKKDLFRHAFEAGLIPDSVPWFEFHRSRNKTSHTYNEDTAEDVFEAAKTFPAHARAFLTELERRL